jgi:hypothetical protein
MSPNLCKDFVQATPSGMTPPRQTWLQKTIDNLGALRSYIGTGATNLWNSLPDLSISNLLSQVEYLQSLREMLLKNPNDPNLVPEQRPNPYQDQGQGAGNATVPGYLRPFRTLGVGGTIGGVFFGNGKFKFQPPSIFPQYPPQPTRYPTGNPVGDFPGLPNPVL